MKLICLVCDKELRDLFPEPVRDHFIWPTIDGGGHVEISFGYGSRYDDINNTANSHLALICDDCYEKAFNSGKITNVYKETITIVKEM